MGKQYNLYITIMLQDSIYTYDALSSFVSLNPVNLLHYSYAVVMAIILIGLQSCTIYFLKGPYKKYSIW